MKGILKRDERQPKESGDVCQREVGGAQRETGGAQREIGGAQREIGGAQREIGGVLQRAARHIKERVEAL